MAQSKSIEVYSVHCTVYKSSNNNNSNHYHKITNAEIVLQQDVYTYYTRDYCAKRETSGSTSSGEAEKRMK